MNAKKFLVLLLVFVILVSGVTACGTAPKEDAASAAATGTATPTTEASPTPSATPLPTDTPTDGPTATPTHAQMHTPTPTPTSGPVPTEKPAMPTTPTASTPTFKALPGMWRGTTWFGSFSFVVSSSGGEILRLNLVSQVSQGGGVYTVRHNQTWMRGVPIDADGYFDLSDPESDLQLVFRGQFSPDGTSATGLWEMHSGSLSAEWSIQR